jgi:hypothetical protein
MISDLVADDPYCSLYNIRGERQAESILVHTLKLRGLPGKGADTDDRKCFLLSDSTLRVNVLSQG